MRSVEEIPICCYTARVYCSDNGENNIEISTNRERKKMIFYFSHSHLREVVMFTYIWRPLFGLTLQHPYFNDNKTLLTLF